MIGAIVLLVLGVLVLAWALMMIMEPANSSSDKGIWAVVSLGGMLMIIAGAMK